MEMHVLQWESQGDELNSDQATDSWKEVCDLRTVKSKLNSMPFKKMT